CQQLYNTPRTF
nr:immunoglobulin light chain junction region [Macaca mulatta]